MKKTTPLYEHGQLWSSWRREKCRKRQLELTSSNFNFNELLMRETVFAEGKKTGISKESASPFLKFLLQNLVTIFQKLPRFFFRYFERPWLSPLTIGPANVKKGVMLHSRFWDTAIWSRAINLICAVCGFFEQLYLRWIWDFFHSVFFAVLLNASALRTSEKVFFLKKVTLPPFGPANLQKNIRQVLVAMSMLNRCAKFHADSPSGKMLNSVSRARSNICIRRQPFLCTTLYRNPMQRSNFGDLSDQVFLWIFLWAKLIHARRLSSSSIPLCKRVNKWPKTQINGVLP